MSVVICTHPIFENCEKRKEKRKRKKRKERKKRGLTLAKCKLFAFAYMPTTPRENYSFLGRPLRNYFQKKR